jgi:hypothetical protein
MKVKPSPSDVLFESPFNAPRDRPRLNQVRPQLKFHSPLQLPSVEGCLDGLGPPRIRPQVTNDLPSTQAKAKLVDEASPAPPLRAHESLAGDCGHRFRGKPQVL